MKKPQTSHRRALLLFTFFIVFAVLAAGFIFVYKQKTDQWVQAYAGQIAICENIVDEMDCVDKVSCEGIYGPSCADCADSVFLRCQRIPEKILKDNEIKKQACAQAGGQWYRNKSGFYCVYLEPGLKP